MADRTLLFVGCLNREAPYFQGARGKGIAVFAFDDRSGDADPLFEADDFDNPTFLTIDAEGRTLYANSEVFGRKEGAVAAYRIDRATGRLDYLNMQPGLGSICAYNALTADGRFLLLANYGHETQGPDRSVVVFPIAPDGSLQPACASLALTGGGPDAARQERAHAHCIREIGRTGMLLVSDLGTDRLLTLRLGPRGELAIAFEMRLAPVAGPRHIALSADAGKAFVVNELDSTVQSFRCDEGGRLEPVSRLPTVPGGVGENHCADVHLSPDERFLYASNRGHDSIAIFAVDAASGALEPRGHAASLGATPRNFAITPSGRHVLVANQNSDEIVVFRRDAETGELADTGKRIAVGTPMCVRVLA